MGSEEVTNRDILSKYSLPFAGDEIRARVFGLKLMPAESGGELEAVGEDGREGVDVVAPLVRSCAEWRRA